MQLSFKNLAIPCNSAAAHLSTICLLPLCRTRLASSFASQAPAELGYIDAHHFCEIRVVLVSQGLHSSRKRKLNQSEIRKSLCRSVDKTKQKTEDWCVALSRVGYWWPTKSWILLWKFWTSPVIHNVSRELARNANYWCPFQRTSELLNWGATVWQVLHVMVINAQVWRPLDYKQRDNRTAYTDPAEKAWKVRGWWWQWSWPMKRYSDSLEKETKGISLYCTKKVDVPGMGRTYLIFRQLSSWS